MEDLLHMNSCLHSLDPNDSFNVFTLKKRELAQTLGTNVQEGNALSKAVDGKG